MSMRFRTILAALTASALLIGCAANKPAPPKPTPSAPPPSSTATAPAVHDTARTKPRARKTAPARAANSATNSAATVSTILPERTDIAACDDYLASYMACHRAAKIYAPEQLSSHYEAMRTSLLRDAMDATIRPQLASRCNSLATQLRQALHGKACAPAPAPTSTSP